MANINKIRLSGTTYNIEDENASKTVELTQAQYDALATKEPNTYYVITDATAVDMANYYDKTETDDLLDAKQDALVSGTNIKTINNESILGSGNIDIQGGGATYTAGTNIDITNDTINCTLPITAGTNSSGKGIIIGDSECSSTGIYGLAIGHNADATGQFSVAIGSNASATNALSFHMGSGGVCSGTYNFNFGDTNRTTKEYQIALGRTLEPKNNGEIVFGYMNNSTTGSTTFGNANNTLFSVGNGYGYQSTNNYHNAFEIRQNGDIYIPNTDDTTDTSTIAYSTYPMVRLQDTITATASNTTALGGLKLVSLTQAQYDALSTKDASTIYFING